MPGDFPPTGQGPLFSDKLLHLHLRVPPCGNYWASASGRQECVEAPTVNWLQVRLPGAGVQRAARWIVFFHHDRHGGSIFRIDLYGGLNVPTNTIPHRRGIGCFQSGRMSCAPGQREHDSSIAIVGAVSLVGYTSLLTDNIVLMSFLLNRRKGVFGRQTCSGCPISRARACRLFSILAGICLNTGG